MGPCLSMGGMTLKARLGQQDASERAMLACSLRMQDPDQGSLTIAPHMRMLGKGLATECAYIHMILDRKTCVSRCTTKGVQASSRRHPA
jgi:hypothetical protein